MNWNVVRIDTTEAASEIISSILIDAGAGGVELIGGSVPAVQNDEYLQPLEEKAAFAIQAYYGEADFENVLTDIKQRVAAAKKASEVVLGSMKLTINEIEDTDWNANFKKHFTTFRAAGNVVIKPTWEEYEAQDGDIVVEMDPGMAFGSGVHETTKMCLDLAQKYMPADASVLDVGCGSGILGIACAKMGAAEVLALDYDRVSVTVTQENAVRNEVGCLTAKQSDLLANAGEAKYDVIFANIIADIVIRLNNDVKRCMNDDTVYIVSGIIDERLDDVTASIEANGLEVIETRAMADWRAMAVKNCTGDTDA